MNKKIIRISALIVAFIFFISCLITVFFLFFYKHKGHNKVYYWSNDDLFDLDSIITLEKEKNKDFVILNLADIQLCDIENFFNKTVIKQEIDYLIEAAKPDLITLTGDQTWSNENLLSIKFIINILESHNIPYAPIFGNHDYGNEYDSAVASLNYCCDLYENAEHCLFSRGPSNLDSLGNYIINIREENKIIKTLYMLDAGYNDVIKTQQIEWVKWNAENLKKYNDNNYIKSMCFMHKPIPQFADSFYSFLDNESSSSVNVLANSSLYGIDDNGFYNIAKSIGINHFIAGHQHTNSFSIGYDNCTFTFALKTGELSYYYDDGKINYNGGTLFIIGNEEKVKNIYVDRDDFHINGSVNNFDFIIKYDTIKEINGD